MRKISIALAVFLLAGCEADPLVSDFNGHSVKIQTSAFSTADARPKAQAEADRICGRVGKRAEYASSREVPGTYVYEHLFLCL